MKKIFLLLFVIASVPKQSHSQRLKIDSLLTVLKSAEEDTNKVNHLSNLCWEYLGIGSYDTAHQYGEQALSLAKKIYFKKGIGSAYNSIGAIYWNEGNYNKALKNFIAALKILEELGDQKRIAAACNNVGIIHYSQGQYEQALEYYFKSLKIDEARGDKKGMTESYNNIGVVYHEQNQHNKALEYHLNALKLRKETNDKHGMAYSYDNIGVIYKEQRHYDDALKSFSKALAIQEEIGDKQGQTISLINCGIVYYHQKKYDQAIKLSERGLAIAKSIGSRESVKDAYDCLYEAYARMHDFKKAYEYHKLYSEEKDSLLNEGSSKQITEMQTKYETEKKEQQITLLNKDKEIQDAQLNRQKIVIWSVAGGLLVVLILSVFIFRERRKSEKLLLNILPAETAKELKRNGKATARHYESVTVMFTDFKGFTSIAERLSAEELVSELDFLFKKFDEIISKYNIEKIKTIGDAYMCASGLPTPNSNHAENIVKAAIEIQSWMIAQNNKWNLRVGVHTGPVTAGVVGDKKFAYDIWGDAVNIASRMESSGEPNKINISGATHELIKDKFKCEFRGKIPAKNKGEIEMYFVDSHLTQSSDSHEPIGVV